MENYDDVIFKTICLKKNFSDYQSIKYPEIIIKRKKINIIQGTTGIGKTSLLNLLGLMDKTDFNLSESESDVLYRPEPNLKEISYRRDVYNNSKKEVSLIRNDFGFLFQHDHLLDDMTCRENIEIRYFLKFPGQKKDEVKIKTDILLELKGFQDLKYQENTNSPPPINRSPASLSGGQRHRVALLRALIHSPRVLFTDEPLASVDEKTAKSIVEVLVEEVHKKGVTIIAVIHDKEKDLFSDSSEMLNIIDLNNSTVVNFIN